MKKLLALLIPVIIIGCNTTDDPEILPACQTTAITFFEEGAYTNYVFEKNSEDAYQLTTVTVYEGTDSSYVYTYTYDGKLQSITQTEDGESITFSAVYVDNKLSKVVSVGDPDEGDGELVLTYSGDKVTAVGLWIEAIDENLYKVGEFKMTYNSSGDLTKTEQYIDIIAVFSIAFGGVPTEPYTPIFGGSIEYTYGTEAAPNPLYGVYNVETPDLTFMKNMPISMVEKDDEGTVTGSESYTITLNDKGFPTMVTFGTN